MKQNSGDVLERRAPNSASSSPPATGKIQSSVQILTFEPGLYAIDIHADSTGITDSGLSLPCARFDPIDAGIGRAAVVAVSPSGWISAADGTMFLRVQNDATDIVLTTYRLTGNTPALDLQIRAIKSIGAIEMAGSLPPRASLPMHRELPSLAHLNVTVLAHVERLGDVVVGPAEWAGATGRDCAVEGFSIQTQHSLSGVQLEYQAILGEQWQTPWFPNGTFCGSRGMSLPILGFRLRVVGESAERYKCSYTGMFLGGEQVGPLADGQACSSSSNALVAMRIEITEKAGADSPRQAAIADGELQNKARLGRKARVVRLSRAAE